LTTGAYPKGISGYLRATDTDSRIIVRHNSGTTKKLVSITTAGVATDISTGTDIASNNKMRFINTNDNLYCMNGSDPYGKLNGITYTTLKQAAIQFKGTGSKSDLSVIPQNTTAYTYIIEIDANGTPDTFKRNKD